MTVLREVTPAEAERWLATATQKVTPDRVAIYVKAMRDGRWEPERYPKRPITFSPKGRLVKGNHRVHAVVEHGEPVLMWVRER